MTELQRLQSATRPTVTAFTDFYHREGPQAAQGLIAGLIKYLDQLEADAVPKKH